MEMLQQSGRFFVILCRKDRLKEIWNHLHTSQITGKKLVKNEFQWMMCFPHFLALSWVDTKVVNYLTNYHSPNELQKQFKRERGETFKKERLIPGI